jgi:hypothetical protein
MFPATPDPALTALESSLAELRPQPGHLDRDRLFYQAGRSSVRSRGWFWPGCAAALAVVAASLGAVLLTRPQPQPIVQVLTVPVAVPVPLSSAQPSQVAPNSVAMRQSPSDEVGNVVRANNIRQRQEVFRWGVDALPESHALPPAEEPMPMEQLLGVPGDTLDRSTCTRFRSVLFSGI